ncbi:MAG: cysteine hydrolase [Defluviitaleaceae bacterium]|nr:cysteine hydrolase [Defluviitaleaceae bacterium]
MQKVLVVIDMQKDFIDGTLGTKEAVGIVDAVAKRIAESTNEIILFTQDTHGQDYLQTPEGKKLPVIHCVKNTPGWEIDPKIKLAWRENKSTLIIDELQENTFFKPVFGSVDLVEFLQSLQNKISEIELVGLCTDICVVSNAIMIKNTLPNIPIRVTASLCAGVTPKSHTEALNTMKMCQIDVI